MRTNLSNFRPLWTLLLLLTALTVTACAGSQNRADETWPTADVLPQQAPDELDEDAAASVLERGSDGFLYVVGGLPEDVTVGSSFMARYSGEWPLDDLPRPPLAVGRVVQILDGGTAVVNLEYQLPDTDLEGLEVTWEVDPAQEKVGKGVANVAQMAQSDERNRPSAILAVGADHGVQKGDVYALLGTPEDVDASVDLQLSRRLKSVCIVTEPGKTESRCDPLPQHSGHPTLEGPSDDQRAIFLEHVIREPPQNGTIQVAGITGGEEDVRSQILEQMRGQLQKAPEANADVESIDAELDATRDDFHRVGDSIERVGGPQLVIGGSIVERDGEEHLVVNYTGVGPASGPGMVAAPPQGGVDFGPVEDVEDEQFRNLAATVWTALLVYRGQTSEAMLHIHQLLSDPNLYGPLRWHLRDQYAMRWNTLGYTNEAFWLILQDEAIAENRDNRRAKLNAMGSRVRMYDFLGLPDRAVEAAKNYLDAYDPTRPEAGYLSALGMYAEMLANAERFDAARDAVDRMNETCPDGCQGDLFSFLAGVFWAIPANAAELQRDVLSRLVQLAQESGGDELASARLYQGVDYLKDGNAEQALVAFLEAERLFEEQQLQPGVARANYFQMIAHMSLGDNQQAFEAGRKSLEINRTLRDFEGVARTYERMASLYNNIDFSERPGPYVRASRQILTKAFESQVAQGNMGTASEVMFTLAGFMFRIGQVQQVPELFQKSVSFALSATRFDIAALSHLYLAMIARGSNNEQAFQQEIQMARMMAELAEDPRIMETINEALQPEDDEGDIPTEML